MRKKQFLQVCSCYEVCSSCFLTVAHDDVTLCKKLRKEKYGNQPQHCRSFDPKVSNQ